MEVSSENLLGVHEHNRLHQIEAPLKDDEFMVFKSTSHFVALFEFLNVVEPTYMNPRVVWLHRNTFDQLESTTAITKGVQKRYNKGISVDDFAVFNKIMVEWTEVQMKNAIVAREVWLLEDLDIKMLLDFPFKKLFAQPKETVNEINELLPDGLYARRRAGSRHPERHNSPKNV